MNSDDESVERGSPISKISPSVTEHALNARLKETVESLKESRDGENNHGSD